MSLVWINTNAILDEMFYQRRRTVENAMHDQGVDVRANQESEGSNWHV